MIAYRRNLIGAVLILALLVWSPLSSAQSAASQEDLLASRQVIENQLDAFLARDHERAYSFASPGIRQMFPDVNTFTAMVKNGYAAIYDNRARAFGRNMLINGEIHQEVIITGPDGKQWQAVYSLKQQDDGDWKITGVKLNPHKGASV